MDDARSQIATLADADIWHAEQSTALIGVSLIEVDKPTVAPAMKLADSGKNLIIEAGGEAQLGINVLNMPQGDTAAVNIAGAGVKSTADASGAKLPSTANGYSLPLAGQYAFNLSGLIPGTIVTATVQEYTGTTPRGDPIPIQFVAVSDSQSPRVSTSQP